MVDRNFGQGTIIDSSGHPQAAEMRIKAEEDRIKQDKINCINSGGEWDEQTNTCSFPLPKTESPLDIKPEPPKTIGGTTSPELAEQIQQQHQEETPQQKQQIIFDEQGNATGVVQPDGRALLGLNQSEVAGIMQSGAVAADAQQQPNLSGQVGQFGE